MAAAPLVHGVLADVGDTDESRTIAQVASAPLTVAHDAVDHRSGMAVQREGEERADVLTVTAVKDEWAAVLAVDDGAKLRPAARRRGSDVRRSGA